MEKAFVCVSTDPSSIQNVFQNIKSIEGVEGVEMVYGTMTFALKLKEKPSTLLNKL